MKGNWIMISRREFIGGLGAMIVAPTIGSVDDEFERCKRDILYWVDNYLSVHDSMHGWLEMSPQQREYLKRMSEAKDYLFCAKGRQIGASTANLVFAHWKTRFFENHHVFIVEPNSRNVKEAKHIDACIFQLPSRCQEGSMVHITTPREIERGIDWSSPNNTFIMDEFAWWGYDCMEKGRLDDLTFILRNSMFENYVPGSRFIVPSTTYFTSGRPSLGNVFSTLMGEVIYSRRMVLPNTVEQRA